MQLPSLATPSVGTAPQGPQDSRQETQTHRFPPARLSWTWTAASGWCWVLSWVVAELQGKAMVRTLETCGPASCGRRSCEGASASSQPSSRCTPASWTPRIAAEPCSSCGWMRTSSYLLGQHACEADWNSTARDRRERSGLARADEAGSGSVHVCVPVVSIDASPLRTATLPRAALLCSPSCRLRASAAHPLRKSAWSPSANAPLHPAVTQPRHSRRQVPRNAVAL